jgi:hypothetical protein
LLDTSGRRGGAQRTHLDLPAYSGTIVELDPNGRA